MNEDEETDVASVEDLKWEEHLGQERVWQE